MNNNCEQCQIKSNFCSKECRHFSAKVKVGYITERSSEELKRYNAERHLKYYYTEKGKRAILSANKRYLNKKRLSTINTSQK